MIRHILFPIDFSPPCLQLAPCLKTIAQQYQARVTFIHVTAGDGMAEVEKNLEALMEEGKISNGFDASLTELFDQDFSQLPTESLTAAGEPSEVITRFVHQRGVDLVMMRTYGDGPFRNASLGSVANGVLQGSLCPVWTAAHVEQSTAQHCPCRMVLCAVDATPKSTPVIQWAARFSRDCGARLRLVHVVHVRKSREDDEPSPAFLNEVTQMVDGLQRMVGIHVPVSVASGKVADEIQKEVLHQHADLLVIGRGLLDAERGRLGRDSRGIIQRAPCPVVSL